ncbi:hypothetical protein AZE42_09157 [Rhizopogon vesiculosus]|uniref:Uncharacterized protein n=1 Tax=Rhizopogon vesiculosus TaxID=180088 RepID=A0A1J8QHQ6_9AGAM|nr:hypothetical protein AZE42_09157 [Rhizopogon vesiculosus]
MSNPSPQVRRRPTKHSSTRTRDSTLVRASVLETALELGIAHSSTVANWIFNSPLPEELEGLDDIPPETEEEETLTPALTFASNITSDDSSSLSSPQNNVASASQTHTHKPSVFEAPHVHFNEFASGQLTLSLPPAQLSTPVKASNSSGKSSNDTEIRSSNDVKLQTDRQRVTPSPAKSEAGYGSDGHYLSDSAGLKKSGKAKGKAKKGKPTALDLRPASVGEPGYSSDGGYLSASSSKSQKSSKGKSRAMAFFRRKPKKSQQVSDDDNDDIPPVPAMPSMPVPSSPRPLKHLGVPSSPTRSGFTPLTLSFNASPPGSRKGRSTPPPARVVSPSPTPTLPRPSELRVNSMPMPSPLPPSMPARHATLPIVHTSLPMTPPTAVSLSSSQTPGTPIRSSPHPSSRHIGIRPAAPPPTQPLPQPPSPPMPITPSRSAPGPPPLQALPPVPAQGIAIPPSTPTTSSRRMPPFRPLPMAPVPVPPVQPLRIRSPVRRENSPASLRVMFSPRPQLVHTASDSVVPQRTHINSEAAARGYLSHTTTPSDESFESRPSKNGAVRTQHSDTPPLFLQRRVHGMQGFPRHPPPDSPLPQVPDAHHAQFPLCHSKFHEHFSSVSPMSHTPAALLTPRSASRSGSSSGPSVRSTCSSTAPSVSTSESHGRLSQHSGGAIDAHARPETRSSSSSRSETSNGKQTSASIAREHSHWSIFDTRSEVSASVYDERSSTYDEEVGNDPMGVQADSEDDASLYPSDEQTAGRRTMYLVENGHALDDGGEGDFPPPLPRRTGGYF